ncbi:DUF4385 domain-containing protein [Chryseobacterium sp. FH1]|uniref:DUF4385 domain-containing protein n=1 Tax=Chryseobacterium sp. FH1 TaxID=1233951 RepID=UPI0004E46BA0|nr:DUF4385 domain-containing protein [Chryseobacterium sp. FH1]KFC19598.1 hypothetical protein IO90_09965 [Chryseobacterium sp. FH1]
MGTKQPSYLNFRSDEYAWKSDINYREHPELYKVGKGEQGVLICEPYKTEIGPYWRSRNSEIATESSNKIFQMFISYLDRDDFVGADMARTYLQMGFTRARRYFNYKGGKKYDSENDYQLLERGTIDLEKARSAEIYKIKWKEAENNVKYSKMKEQWKRDHG